MGLLVAQGGQEMSGGIGQPEEEYDPFRLGYPVRKDHTGNRVWHLMVIIWLIILKPDFNKLLK
ncbi:MAG: hypothetical protein G8237_09950 [Magnetococcales bacterium]|nr:hypothetical protein [Magnetococcales bacterium]NGZ06666.1 hypothetical protein [Magnetococcales bacterium]